MDNQEKREQQRLAHPSARNDEDVGLGPAVNEFLTTITPLIEAHYSSQNQIMETNLKLQQEQLKVSELREKNLKELDIEALKYKDKQHNRQFILAIIIVFLIVALVIYGMHANKDEIVKQIIPILITAVATGLGGYSWGRYKASGEKKD